MKSILNTNKADEESIRIVIALGIIATVLSAIIILPDGAMTPLKTTLSISGIFSFLYVLTTGSNLKYKNQGEIGEITFSEKLRKTCYDMAIDSYGYNFFIIVAYLFAYLFGMRDYSVFDNRLWFGYAVSGVLFLVVLIIGGIAKNRESKTK